MLPTCQSCGRALNPGISPNGEDPCVICDPKKKSQKPVQGVGPVTVLREDLSQRTPEAVEAKQEALKKAACLSQRGAVCR
jgi:hypothetical protein